MGSEGTSASGKPIKQNRPHYLRPYSSINSPARFFQTDFSSTPAMVAAGCLIAKEER